MLKIKVITKCDVIAVGLCARELKIPITAKIRIFEDVKKTIEYAQMLEEAGCKVPC